MDPLYLDVHVLLMLKEKKNVVVVVIEGDLFARLTNRSKQHQKQSMKEKQSYCRSCHHWQYWNGW